MFDAILENVASRFGISPDKAKLLLGALTALIFNPGRGGPAGFVDLLRNKGLGDIVQSWIGGGPNQPISPAQLEGALGSGEIASIASQAGLDNATASNALSGLLPDLFNGLTENGQLPSAIPASLTGLLGGAAGMLGGLGRSGAAAVGAGAAAMGAGAAAARDGGSYLPPSAAVTSSRSKWPLWILLLALLGLGWYFLHSCQRSAAPTTESTAPSAMTEPTPAPTAPADSAASAVSDAAAAASAAAHAALDKLSAGQGSFSADDLVKALNLMVIHFDTGSARISSDSLEILDKAAAAIKKAPAGTRIEVGGHTDNTGDAASNQSLSQARAEAVAAQLATDGVDAGMLSSKGYGQDKPVADNGTDEGRARNRRIEFTVQP